MQLYALDKSTLILATHAAKHQSYHCPECQGFVRLRGGGRRQVHFYHVRRPASCRQHGKSLSHLQIQLHLKSQIPTLELEKKFQNRIADAFWAEEKIVFEIQCSPILVEEAQKRCEDYRRLGLTPVWILHDRRYNHRRLTPAEEYLRTQTTTFFTDGRVFYDQFDICQTSCRLYQGPKLIVDLTLPQKKPTQVLFSRRWPLSFRGDLFDQKLNLHTLKKLQQGVLSKKRRNRWKNLYRYLLYHLLETCT